MRADRGGFRGRSGREDGQIGRVVLSDHRNESLQEQKSLT